MTAPATRAVATPAALAAMRRRLEPGAGRPADAPPYDRHAWESAVQADGSLFYAPRLVAFVLAHHAGEDGFLPAGGIQHYASLAQATGLVQRTVKLSIRDLDRAGLLKRPPMPDGRQTHVARPITLVVPETAERVPPSTGEPR